ncbi:MAG: TetR family transcriptional regulator [Erysipelotrichaceae bacterium]|nr:TetR family transcriptional regulator [Erysipelotrichaceae bacterium]MDY5252087.1 TetR family transcriptional regulator [Erysipelotrichaceae bacterium]
MVNRKSAMKINLCESLREIMLKKPFEKITIKNICDEAGVIRATFYNHFEDKYDCLNAIVAMDMLNDEQEIIDVESMFKEISLNKPFYRMAYRVEGQNSFKDMMIDNIAMIINRYFKSKRNNYLKEEFSDLFLARYYATMIELYVHEWIFSNDRFSLDKLRILLGTSFYDFVK